jgi:hypothetical protein
MAVFLWLGYVPAWFIGVSLHLALAAGISPGQLDEALPLLLPTLEGDPFGSVSSVCHALLNVSCLVVEDNSAVIAAAHSGRRLAWLSG